MSFQNWFLLIILSILWGGSFFFVEIILQDITPLTAVFLRISCAVPIIWGYVKWLGYAIPWQSGLWRNYAIMGLLNNIIPFSLIVWGQNHITSSVAAILNGTTPIFAILLAHLLTVDERMKSHKAIGIGAGFIGMIVMLWPDLSQGISLGGLGQLAVIGGAISYAFAGIWGKRLTAMPPAVNVFGMLSCSALGMVPLILSVENPFMLDVGWQSWSAVAGFAVLSTALAYVIYFILLARVGATNLLLVTFLIPISAIILGMGLLGEVLSFHAIMGMGIIFTGLAVIDGRILPIIQAKWLVRSKRGSHHS